MVYAPAQTAVGKRVQGRNGYSQPLGITSICSIAESLLTEHLKVSLVPNSHHLPSRSYRAFVHLSVRCILEHYTRHSGRVVTETFTMTIPQKT